MEHLPTEMPITEHGLKEVERALANAIKQEQQARETLDSASELVDRLREAIECDHSELELAGHYMGSNLTQCIKCGFTWED